MRYCITGGLGFVGSALVQQLLEGSHEVHVIDNMSAISPAAARIRSAITLHEADICDEHAMLTIMKTVQPDICIHLAAMHFIPACNADPAKAFRINVLGTLHILLACEHAEVPHTIIMSSGAIYADSVNPLDESSSPIVASDIYGLTKLQAEQLAQQFSRRSGRRKFSIVRLFNVYGYGETNPHIIPEIIAQLKTGSELTLGNISPQRDFIHVQDAADGLIAISGHTSGEAVSIFNLCSGHAYSMKEVIEKIAALTGRPIAIRTDPARWRTADKQCQLGDPKYLANRCGFTCKVSIENGLKDLLTREGII